MFINEIEFGLVFNTVFKPIWLKVNNYDRRVYEMTERLVSGRSLLMRVLEQDTCECVTTSLPLYTGLWWHITADTLFKQPSGVLFIVPLI